MSVFASVLFLVQASMDFAFIRRTRFRSVWLRVALLLIAAQIPCHLSAGNPRAIERELEKLCSGLSLPKASARRAASNRLLRLGEQAHQSLVQVIYKGDAEAASRSLSILQAGLNGPSPETSRSAKKALSEIAAGGGPYSVSAQIALRQESGDELLPKATVRFRAPPLPAAPAFGNPKPMINRVRIRVANGKREIQVDNGGSRFHFRDVEGGLEVERPDRKGGRTRKIYRDARDLLKHDPDAFQAYQKAGGDTKPR